MFQLPFTEETDEYGYQIGDCFQEAVELLLQDDIFLSYQPKYEVSENAVLVHGWPRLQREPYEKYAHAWVEDGDVCYHPAPDGMLDVPKPLYYKMGQIDENECWYYTKKETKRKLLEYEHYGPWENEFY